MSTCDIWTQIQSQIDLFTFARVILEID